MSSAVTSLHLVSLSHTAIKLKSRQLHFPFISMTRGGDQAPPGKFHVCSSHISFRNIPCLFDPLVYMRHFFLRLVSRSRKISCQFLLRFCFVNLLYCLFIHFFHICLLLQSKIITPPPVSSPYCFKLVQNRFIFFFHLSQNLAAILVT